MLFKFELGYNITEATKNICHLKGEHTVDHSTVTRLLKKFCSIYKKHDDQGRSDKPKTVNSEAVAPSATKTVDCVYRAKTVDSEAVAPRATTIKANP